MEYINGKIFSCRDSGTKDTGRQYDGRLYLSEMTWEQYEKYLKSMAKKSKNNGHDITDKGNGGGIPDHPER